MIRGVAAVTFAYAAGLLVCVGVLDQPAAKDPPHAEVGRQLDAVGARVAGAVLNDPDGRVPHYGGYSYGYPRG